MYLSDDMTPQELEDAAAEQRALRTAQLPELRDVLDDVVTRIRERRAEGDGFNGIYPLAPERYTVPATWQQTAHVCGDRCDPPNEQETHRPMVQRVGSGLYVPAVHEAGRFRGDIRY